MARIASAARYVITILFVLLNFVSGAEGTVEKVSNLPLSIEQLGITTEELRHLGKIMYGGFQYKNTELGERVIFTVSSFSANISQLWITELYPWRPVKLYETRDTDIYIGLYRISPSGRKVLFSIEMHRGGGGDIYLVNSDGSGLRNVTQTPEENEGNVIWLGNDSTALIETSGCWFNRNLPKEFAIVDLVTLRKKKVYFVSDDPFNMFATLSHDGTKVEFMKRLGTRDYTKDEPGRIELVAEMDLENQEVIELPENARPKRFAAALSPDGNRFKFDRFDWNKEERKTVGEIWVMSIDGSGKRCILRERDIGHSIGWSPDSRFIYFSKGQNVYKVQVE